MNQLLQNKVAIVTGGAGGIGSSCVARLIQEGANVIIADSNLKKGQQLASKFNSQGASVEFVCCDVSNKIDVDNLIDACIDKFNVIDICVSTAGIMHTDTALDLKIEDFDKVLATNTRGTWLVSQACAKKMVQLETQGAIVNMASVHAFVANVDQVAYAVSKGAIVQMTRAMAVSLAPHQIRVNSVAPGAIDSPLLQVSMKNLTSKEKMLSRTPLGRPGRKSEVADAVVFLASDQSSYITGHCLVVDGGRLCLNYTMDS